MLGIVAGTAKVGAGVLAAIAALLVFQAAPAGTDPLAPGRETAAGCQLQRSELRILLEADEQQRERMRREMPNCQQLPRRTWDRGDLQRAGVFAGGAVCAFILAAFAGNAARRG